MKLSVLIAVYHKECPEFLRHALDSLDAQIVRAGEVVVVYAVVAVVAGVVVGDVLVPDWPGGASSCVANTWYTW